MKSGGVDNNDFTPVSFGLVKRFIDKQIDERKEQNKKLNL